MAYSPAHQIERITPAISPVLPTDSMAEAGRKILLAELARMLQHEAGSRTGADIEDVHNMRVAIRRMRSAMRLLKPYLKQKAVREYNTHLRALGQVLGEVRDLDVMIEQLQQYQAGLDGELRISLQTVLDELARRRDTVRAELNEYLDTKTYRRFVKSFRDWLMQPAPEPAFEGTVVPYRVQHALPMLVYDRLAAVRAYDTVVETADTPTLHALRIEFKRLRYLLSLFQEVLGPQAADVIGEIKTIQDYLGHLNDGAVARERLDGLLDEDNPALAEYLAFLEAQALSLRADFLVAWARFNSRKVQQKLSSAVLALV